MNPSACSTCFYLLAVDHQELIHAQILLAGICVSYNKYCIDIYQMDNLENQAKAEALYQKLKSASSYSQATPIEYEKCLQLNPNHVLALWQLAKFYAGDYDYAGHGSYWDEFNCANHEKARACFTKIHSLDPKFSPVYLRLGQMCCGSDKEKQLEYYLTYVNMNPQDYDAIRLVGQSYQHLNRYEEAIACFTKCLGHNQKDTWSLTGLANIYEKQGNFKGALQCLKKCIATNDKNASFHAQIGHVYDKMGNVKEAINSYRKSSHLRCNNKQAQAYLMKHLTKDSKH